MDEPRGKFLKLGRVGAVEELLSQHPGPAPVAQPLVAAAGVEESLSGFWGCRDTTAKHAGTAQGPYRSCQVRTGIFPTRNARFQPAAPAHIGREPFAAR